MRVFLESPRHPSPGSVCVLHGVPSAEFPGSRPLLSTSCVLVVITSLNPGTTSWGRKQARKWRHREFNSPAPKRPCWVVQQESSCRAHAPSPSAVLLLSPVSAHLPSPWRDDTETPETRHVCRCRCLVMQIKYSGGTCGSGLEPSSLHHKCTTLPLQL